MTKREAAIVSAYTGFMIGSFSDMQSYAAELIGRDVFTHEFGNQGFADTLHNLSKADFSSIEVIS
jgi:hypothetical protein